MESVRLAEFETKSCLEATEVSGRPTGGGLGKWESGCNVSSRVFFGGSLEGFFGLGIYH